MENFTISEALGFGWEKMKKHFWFFVGLLLLSWLIQIVPTGIANIFKEKIVILYVMLVICAWAIQLIVKMGVIKINLEIFDEDKANLNSLFSCAHLLIRFFLASLVYGLIVLAGLILLIVPGIIWAIKYQFFAYLIVDKNLSPMDAIRKSGEMTKGNKGKLFGLGLLLMLINIGGALFFLVGLLATIPTSMMAMAYVYRKLEGKREVVQ